MPRWLARLMHDDDLRPGEPGGRYARPSLGTLPCIWLLAVASASSSCGPGANLLVPGASDAPGERAALASTPAGRWRWSLITDEPGARRIEVERWQLQTQAQTKTQARTDSGTVSGLYERTVTVLSTDGVPFACSQTLSYEQRTRYRLGGEYRGRHLRLRELGYETAPSPCEQGEHALMHYEGELRDGALVLRWSEGIQTLVPAPGEPENPGAELARAGPPEAAVLSGAWRWQGRTVMPETGQVRVEHEDWTLAEDASGMLTGTLARTVSVFEEQGRSFACSGDTYYRYQDRYTLRGQRTGLQLMLTEIAVQAEDHACLEQRTRHLDTALGVLSGEYLVLTWRGQRQQVLHRP